MTPIVAPFPQRSPPQLLTAAAWGCLKPPPARAASEDLPPSLLELRHFTDLQSRFVPRGTHSVGKLPSLKSCQVGRAPTRNLKGKPRTAWFSFVLVKVIWSILTGRNHAISENRVFQQNRSGRDIRLFQWVQFLSRLRRCCAALGKSRPGKVIRPTLTKGQSILNAAIAGRKELGENDV